MTERKMLRVGVIGAGRIGKIHAQNLGKRGARFASDGCCRSIIR